MSVDIEPGDVLAYVCSYHRCSYHRYSDVFHVFLTPDGRRVDLVEYNLKNLRML